MIIHIIGLGESSSKFNPDGNIVIGVNDAAKITPLDYCLVLDRYDGFNKDRRDIIMNNRYNNLLSFLPEWQVHPDFKLIHINPQRYVVNLNDKRLSISICTPISAVHLAYNLGAKQIVMWGVDFNSHPIINSEIHKIGRVLQSFKEMQKELYKKDVELFTQQESILEFIPTWPPLS